MRAYRHGAWFAALLAVALHAAPTRLVDLPGHETEASWSPDGGAVLFQWERKGDRDVAVLDPRTGEVRVLVPGPGQACYPTWTPDGRYVLYSYGRPTTTALEAAANGVDEGYNLYRVGAMGGTPAPLTAGRVRDYLPRVSATGDAVWFTSTRGLRQNSAGLFRLALGDGPSGPVAILAVDHASGGAVQPDPSPDGRLVAFASCVGVRGNWRLCLLRAADPGRTAPLTADDWVAYAPRWSPDGTLIACTGYRPGDSGWGLYLVEARTGRCLRLDAGPGTARSPSWSPDGRELLFESNAAGSYDLYRLPLPVLTFAPDPEPPAAPPVPVISYRFGAPVAAPVPDLSGTGNEASILGRVPWDAGALCFGEGSLQVTAPKGCDFGSGPFYVTARLRVDRHTDALRLVAVGGYPEHPLGWQIYINDRNQVYFNARSPSGAFVGACSPQALPVGRIVTVTGWRDPQGRVRLYLDGTLMAENSGATMAYGHPRQVRVGCQSNGSAPFSGRLYAIEVGRGAPACHRTRAQELQEIFQ